MSATDLVADDPIDLLRGPSQFRQEHPPGLLAELNAVLKDRNRIGGHVLRMLQAIAGLQSPAAQAVMLRRHLRYRAEQTVTRLPAAGGACKRAIGQQHRYRSGAAGKGGQSVGEPVHGDAALRLSDK